MISFKNAFFLSLFLLQGAVASDGGHAGNGGDFIRQLFIRRGNEIVSSLEKAESKLGFFKKNKITAQSMKALLNINVVQVSSEVLKDNKGSVVDAIGVPGKILLQHKEWREYILKGIPVDRMILHEILRAMGKNDDNYVISDTAPPVTNNFDERFVSPGYRVLREEFRDGRVPNQQELEKFAANPMNCESHDWNSSTWAEASLKMEIWRSKVLRFVEKIPGCYPTEESLYVDTDLQIVSGFINKISLITLRILPSGNEFVTESINLLDTKGPTAITNPSFHARRYIICSIAPSEAN